MQKEIRKEQIPWMMAAGRALLGPVLVLGARAGWNGMTLTGLIVTALVSDIFDGVLARRWKCDTAGVRLFDTTADTIFYGCVLLAMGMGLPAVWSMHRVGIFALLATEAANHGLALAKFGKPPSYHSYLAKTWGLVLAATTITVFATGHGGWLMWVGIALGSLCNAEGMVMTLLLPVWRRDVKTISAALRLVSQLEAAEKLWAAWTGSYAVAQRREVVRRKPATGASASMQSGLWRISGSRSGR